MDPVRIRIRIRNPVIVGPESLQHPARFDATENVWVWEYPTEDEDGAATHTDLFMDVGEPVRFRVAGETFTDTGPSSRPDVAPEVPYRTRVEKLIKFYLFYFWAL
jgi:DNA-directed RNA polymerase III subunit RPC8